MELINRDTWFSGYSFIRSCFGGLTESILTSLTTGHRERLYVNIHQAAPPTMAKRGMRGKIFTGQSSAHGFTTLIQGPWWPGTSAAIRAMKEPDCGGHRIRMAPQALLAPGFHRSTGHKVGLIFSGYISLQMLMLLGPGVPTHSTADGDCVFPESQDQTPTVLWPVRVFNKSSGSCHCTAEVRGCHPQDGRSRDSTLFSHMHKHSSLLAPPWKGRLPLYLRALVLVGPHNYFLSCTHNASLPQFSSPIQVTSP